MIILPRDDKNDNVVPVPVNHDPQESYAFVSIDNDQPFQYKIANKKKKLTATLLYF